MRRRGFTLLELLAVIVILAIIALITIPKIIGIIEEARKNSAKSSALGYIDATEKQMARNLLDSDSSNDITDKDYTILELDNKKVKVKGDKPSDGTVTVQNSKVSQATLIIGDYTVTCIGRICSVTKGSETEVAGVYDASGNQVATWSELVDNYGLDIATNYSFSNYKTKGSGSMYDVLTNNSKLASVKSIIIPDSVTKIGNYAFSGCTSLTSITILDSVTGIGDHAFENCTSLTNITIGNGVTYIGNYAFSGCTSLTSITIPNSVTFIRSFAFSECTSLTSVTIPDSVTKIAYRAFGNCTSLTNVTIGNGVIQILEEAFSGCTSLTSVIFKNTTGWFLAKDDNSTNGININVSNTSENATNLKTTYVNKIWKRN